MKERLPQNICLVGQADNNRKIFVEEYVISYLQKIANFRKEPQIIVFFGDGYEREGVKYYFLKGAASHRASDIMLKRTDEFYFQTVGKQYFPELKGIGWYYMEEGYSEMLKILQDMREQNFGNIKGYYMYFEKNCAMEEYLGNQTLKPNHYENVIKKVVMPGKRVKKSLLLRKHLINSESKGPAPMLAVQVLNMVSLFILIICCIIVVTTLNQYDKMKQLEETVTYLETSIEEQKNLPEE